MDNLESDEARVLPEKTRKKSSFSGNTLNLARPLRFLVNHQRPSKGNSNAAFVHQMDTMDESTFSISPPTYGNLEHIQSFKPLCKPDDKSLPKEVREFYEDQLELITSIEDILVPKSDEAIDHETAYEKRHKRTIKSLTMITLAINIVLVIIKIVAAVISKSLSVISSVVDSVVDLLTSLILIWTARKIKKRDAYKYPGGRTRLEPIAIIILSVIMCSASVQVIFESAETLDQDIEYFTHQNNGSSTKTLPEINMSIVPIVAMVLTIVSKSILFVLCYRIKNPTMYALAEDSRNDVASNIVALACGLIASNALHGRIKKEAIVVDPAGGILISVYIIIAWILQANRQVRRLTGLTAEPSFLQRLTHVVYNYRPDIVTKIDFIQAVHHGTNFFVEVDIGLPASMPLAMAHDIGDKLQNQLEAIDDIERAFVHLDFEFSHKPTSEHKVV
ncbi:unnamed protein product [Rotaria sordida]|uniref:Cation efflux protein cytoplasmic domain-containing protein n=1 Tax=Rotaria sordida TaxID=392033 RepID=A0A813PRR8_9BILA|nr:unnamed protein product [Rotaria sordida]